VVLLDEWDANLDAANLALVHARIEELAKTKVVIEVRHRESQAKAI
jgi:ABC-type transport system involved in cytochrome bd biosynthesis fused ATPase/permease subunit